MAHFQHKFDQDFGTSACQFLNRLGARVRRTGARLPRRGLWLPQAQFIDTHVTGFSIATSTNSVPQIPFRLPTNPESLPFPAAKGAAAEPGKPTHSGPKVPRQSPKCLPFPPIPVPRANHPESL